MASKRKEELRFRPAKEFPEVVRFVDEDRDWPNANERSILCMELDGFEVLLFVAEIMS